MTREGEDSQRRLVDGSQSFLAAGQLDKGDQPGATDKATFASRRALFSK